MNVLKRRGLVLLLWQSWPTWNKQEQYKRQRVLRQRVSVSGTGNSGETSFMV
jgi:hypothetical protein